MKRGRFHAGARARVIVVAVGTTLLGGGVAVASGTGSGSHTNRAVVYTTTTTTTTPPDTTPPTISQASVRPRRFAVASAPTAVSARKHHHHAPKGTTIRFTLSEPSAVALAFTGKFKGHKHGKRCVPGKSKHPRRHPRCTAVKSMGALSRAAEPAGADTVPFSGRIGNRALKPGKYKLTIDATDPSGNKAQPVTLKFTVVKG